MKERKKMNPVKKEKIFKPNIELLLMFGENRLNGWEKVVEDPRSFIKSDREFEPMNNIKKEEKDKKEK